MCGLQNDRKTLLSLCLLGVPVLLALTFSWLLSSVLEAEEGHLRKLDACRPPYKGFSIDILVEKQLFHLQVANLDEAKAAATIPIIGSSSVVNGVDVDLLNAPDSGHGYAFDNFGLIALCAYELPMLEGLFIPQGRRKAVFLYNPWMFGDSVHPQAVTRRWKTSEALAMFPLSRLLREGELELYCEGALAEQIRLFRFLQFYKCQCRRWLAGWLAPLPSAYDYPPGSPPRRWPTLSEPLPLDGLDPFLRGCYTESQTRGATIGWTGLERFLQSARSRGIPILVTPVPLMPSAAMRYCQGIDVQAIDDRVALACRESHHPYIARRALPPLDDSHFRDPVHLHDSGRIVYSNWLAPRLARFADD